MSGYQSILRIRRLEEEVNKLGFMLTAPKHGSWSDNVDQVGLRPKDEESVPIYCRDAEVFCGSLEQLEVWLRGAQWAREYDMMLKVSDGKRRARKEQDERNRQIVKRLKSEELKLSKK